MHKVFSAILPMLVQVDNVGGACYAFLLSLLSSRFTSWYIQKIIVPKCILYELQRMDDLIEKSKTLWAKLRAIPAELKRRSSR